MRRKGFLKNDTVVASHHSLVTPIDWKPGEVGPGEVGPGESPLAGDTY